MAVTSIMTTGAEIVAKEGANVSASVTEAMHDAWVLQIESFINGWCRFNFSDNYATLNIDVKYTLSDIASSLVAIYGIMYDMGGYSGRTEAEDMVTLLRDRAMACLSILRDKKTQEFIKNA